MKAFRHRVFGGRQRRSGVGDDNLIRNVFLLAFFILNFALVTGWSEDRTEDPVIRAAAIDAGKINHSEKKLFEESIRTTKESIARETLDAFYRDALDYYHERQYDAALELLDRVYTIDPYYEDVQSLRDIIRRLKSNQTYANTRSIIIDYMRKGDTARANGQNVLAISYWKQALMVNPDYAPAKKKIQDVNHTIAQKQFEMGYLYYNHGDMTEALDSWLNAIALDPSFKQRGLLVLMSRVELSVRKEQVARLTAQASDQYAKNDLEGALVTFEDLLKLDPRNEEARRMTAKIHIRLGEAAFKAARSALENKLYAKAIQGWEEAIRYDYEVQRSQQSIQETERLVAEAKAPKPPPRKASSKAPPPQAAPATPAPPAQPVDAAQAMDHYRQGLMAIRSKDFHRAIEELDIAAQLDSTDERIYVARQRAHQEWDALNHAPGQQP